MEILYAALAAAGTGIAGFYAGAIHAGRVWGQAVAEVFDAIDPEQEVQAQAAALAAWVPPVVERASWAPWGEDATRRLLKALKENPVCESCQTHAPVYVATWPDEASASFLVCSPCASLIPAGAAKLEEL
jgi:hypothetical protein